jgi:hypothetical protein
MAVAALVFGILGLTALFVVGSVIALVFGYMGKSQIARSNGTETGRGMAITGIVLGWIGVAIGILLVIAIVIGVFLLAGSVQENFGDAFRTGIRQEIAKGLLEIDEKEAGCTAIETYADQGRKHIAQGAPHVDYNSTPPTSGPHTAAAASPGFHLETVPPEELVANLERGEIVLWYRPDGSDVLKDQMQLLAQQEPRATVAAPFTEVPDGYSFYLTAWRHSQLCRSASQGVIDQFRTRYQGRGPQRGTPVFQG